MAIDDVIRAIDVGVEQQIRDVAAASQERAAEIRATAIDASERDYSRSVDERRRALRILANERIAVARNKCRHAVFVARADFLASVRAAVIADLEHRVEDDVDVTARYQLFKPIARIFDLHLQGRAIGEDDRIVFRCRASLLRRLAKLFEEHLGQSANVEWCEDNDIGVGVIVEWENGRVVFDCTIPTLIAASWPKMQIAIMHDIGASEVLL